MKNEIKIVYGTKEYGLMNKQQLDRIIALATKQLRQSTLNGQLSLKTFSILRGMEEESVKVFIKEHESELYKEMRPEIIYAIESDLLDDYEEKKIEKVKKEKPMLVTQHIPTIMKLPRIKIYPLTSPVWKIRTAQDRIFHINLDWV